MYVVLTQDCSIASGKPIELAQLKKKVVNDPDKLTHLFKGKDYNKLFLTVDNEHYEIEEALLTKVESSELYTQLQKNDLIILKQLSDHNRRILVDWRILTYTREPYPDTFNKTLNGYLQSKGNWFISFLQSNSEKIHTVRVYVSPEDDENATEYYFSITALLTQEGEADVNHIASQIKKMVGEFNEYPNIKCLQFIDDAASDDTSSFVFPNELVLNFTISLSEFTFANSYLMRAFNFQYLCY